MFGTRKPFFRAAGTMILQSCQPVSMYCSLHCGESPAPLPAGARDFLRNQTLGIHQKSIILSGLLELLELTWAQLIQSSGPHAALSIISAWGMAGVRVPWAAARNEFLWGFRSPGQQPAVRARLQTLLCCGGGVSQNSLLTCQLYGLVSAILLKDSFALPVLVVAVNSPASCCHRADVFSLCWEILL